MLKNAGEKYIFVTITMFWKDIEIANEFHIHQISNKKQGIFGFSFQSFKWIFKLKKINLNFFYFSKFSRYLYLFWNQSSIYYNKYEVWNLLVNNCGGQLLGYFSHGNLFIQYITRYPFLCWHSKYYIKPFN